MDETFFIIKKQSNAINNQVSFLGKPVFIKNGVNNTIIYGGYSSDPATTGDLRTGNTLNVFSSGIEAENIANFQHYNFILHKLNKQKKNWHCYWTKQHID